MMDDNYFSEYIRLLNNLINKDTSDSSDSKEFDLVNVFCEYISSNPKFKYNGTYLKDSITNFLEKLSYFKKKKNQINKFHKKLSDNYLSLCDWYIIIDNLYIITPDLKFDLLLDFQECMHFKNLINNFNLFKYDTKNITLRYVKISNIDSEKDIIIENEYLNSYQILFGDKYKEIELFSIVESTLKLKKGNIKGGTTNG